MKNLTCTLTLLGLLTTGAAMAESKLSMSPELKGMQKIMRVIGHASLANDPKANESILDILEAKSDLYPQKAGIKNLGVQPKSPELAVKKAPPSRGQKSF